MKMHEVGNEWYVTSPYVGMENLEDQVGMLSFHFWLVVWPVYTCRLLGLFLATTF